MEEAIASLKQRFTTPSADQMQQHPLCSICWTDFDGDDQAVVLPCGHVFGEECIVAWAKGVTPMGRHNGCPYCRAELLPPSMQSRIKALKDLVSDLLAMWPVVVPTLRLFYGGTWGLALAVSLEIIMLAKLHILLSPLWNMVLGLASAAQFVNMVRIAFKLLGWRWTWLSVAATLFVAKLKVDSYTSSS